MKGKIKGKIHRGDPYFPGAIASLLPDIKTIYYEGNLNLLCGRCAAVVGSRQCTAYGRTVAKDLGKRMGEADVVLVSGLAKGIDTAGHVGALEVGGATIAVLGGGTDHVYPAENRRLQQQIADEGLLISEHPSGYVAKPYDFPRRNRMIAALAESLVVVEAGNRSGALITAECAVDMGKRVYAVPGNITSLYSFGTNQLIRDGASPLILLDDLFSDLGIARKDPDALAERLGASERRVWDMIRSHGGLTFDEILHQTGMKTSEVNGMISILEMKGLIFSSMGKIFVAKF